MTGPDVDRLLGETTPPAHHTKRSGAPRKQEVPPLIALWKEEQRAARGKNAWFKKWATHQVAAYRVGLFLGYIGLIFFGVQSFLAGIPVFEFTTVPGFTPVWAAVVVVGGIVGAVGATHAGEEPQTRRVRIFNKVELVGATMLFLTLGIYATILLIVGYGLTPLGIDINRQAVGAGFVALAVHPTVRMVWLFFRPGKVKETIIVTGEVPVVSETKDEA